MRVEMLMELGYSTLARWLHEHGFKLKVPQPWPGRQRQALRETLRELLPGGAIGLWRMDKMGVEGDPHSRRRRSSRLGRLCGWRTSRR